MLCVICKRKFNRESSYYRHQWSDKHLLKQQILEYEKEIKSLEETIARYQDKSETLSQIMHIPILEKCHTSLK
jgi:septal ring factor EnvC (AmiA/AmiB activator)